MIGILVKIIWHHLLMHWLPLLLQLGCCLLRSGCICQLCSRSSFLHCVVLLYLSQYLWVDLGNEDSSLTRALYKVFSLLLAHGGRILYAYECYVSELHKRRTLSLVKLEHQPDGLTKDLGVLLAQAPDPCVDQLLPIVLRSFLVEASDVLHCGHLVEHQSNAEDIALEDVVLGEARVSIDHMGLPKDWREVLGCAADRRCGGLSPILSLTEVIFRLPEIYDLDLSIRKEE
jgi:hypothetical protein